MRQLILVPLLLLGQISEPFSSNPRREQDEKIWLDAWHRSASPSINPAKAADKCLSEFKERFRTHGREVRLGDLIIQAPNDCDISTDDGNLIIGVGNKAYTIRKTGRVTSDGNNKEIPPGK